MTLQTACHDPRSARRSGSQSVTRRPFIEVRLGETRQRFDGREAWALDQLIRAGESGCTPIDNPAPRWSHYVWKLRGAGIAIETVHESHGGPYAGSHARYVLRSPVAVLDQGGLGNG